MASGKSMASGSSRFGLLMSQLEHEDRICSGAQHILASKETDPALRDHINHELQKSIARKARTREQLHALRQDARTDPTVFADTTADFVDHVVQNDESHAAEANSTSSASMKAKQKESGGSSQRQHLVVILELLRSIEPQMQSQVQERESFPRGTAACADTVREALDRETTRMQNLLPAVSSSKRSAQRNRAMAHNLSKPLSKTSNVAGSLGATNQRKRMALLVRATSILRENVRSRYECPTSLLQGVFACLSDLSGTEVRWAAYRFLRYLVVRPPWSMRSAYKERGLDLYLTRTLLRDSRFLREKEEAIKLIRRMVDAGQACVEANQAMGTSSTMQRHHLMSPTIVRALVAAADGTDDPARYLYLETLAELAVFDVRLLCENGGLRLLLSYISDPCARLGPEILSICLHLLDMPCTRRYFDPRCDVISTFSGFIAPATTDQDSLKGTADATCTVLRSWSGLLYSCMGGASVLKALLEALRVNSPETQEAILKMLKMLLALNSPAEVRQSSKQSLDGGSSQSSGGIAKFNVRDSYFMLLTIVLLDNGLLDALLHLIEVRSPLTSSAIDVIQWLSDNADHCLLAEYTHRIHALPEVFQMRFMGKCDDGTISERERASSIFSTLEEHAFRHHSQGQLVQRRLRSHSNATQARSNTQVDDTAFRSLLLEANVLSNKDFAKWNVEALQSLFESVLVNPKRLEEAMRASKLVRRVLSFYHPFAMRFSATAQTQSNQRFVKLGCTIIETLLTTKEGARFLGEDQLLKDIGDCLGTEVMSEQRFRDTLVSGYFDMLGVLSGKAEGRQLMAQANIYSALFRLQDRRTRIDLMQSVLSNIDFTSEGQNRLMLSRAMSSHSRTLRQLAIRRTCDIAMTDPQRWLIRLLVNALYDTVAENRDLASSLLLRACTQSDKVLEMVVSMQPKLDQCLHSLFLKFLSTDRGFDFLKRGDYIDREMDDWYNYRNMVYSTQLEAQMMTAFDLTSGNEDERRWNGDIPSHFYGELVKTREGCTLLETRGHFVDFVRFARIHASEESDHEILQKVKSILWALAHIGTSTGGLPLLEREEVISIMIWIAENSGVSSLRGTSYFALNLIASTEAGAELIQDAGWRISVSTTLHRGQVYAFCMPSTAFLTLTKWTVQHPSLPPPSSIDQTASKLNQVVLKHVAGLGNSIIAAKSSKSLTRLKQRHPSSFQLPSAAKEAPKMSSASLTDERWMKSSEILFVQVLHLLDTRPFRQSIRRYVWDLFAVRLEWNVVQRLLIIAHAFRQSLDTDMTSAGGHSASVVERRQHSLADGSKGAGQKMKTQHFSDKDHLTDASDESDDSDEARSIRRERLTGSSVSEHSLMADRNKDRHAFSAGVQKVDIRTMHGNLSGMARPPPTPENHRTGPTRRIIGGFSLHED